MRIVVANVTEERRQLELAVPAERLAERLGDDDESELRAGGPIQASLEIYRVGEDLVISGTARTHLRAVCARCVEPFDLPLEAPVEMFLAEKARAAAEGFGEDDVALATFTGEEVDLAPLCFDQLLLALPSRLLCREACRGLCPQCGDNLNLTTCGCRPATIPGTGPLASLAEQLTARGRHG